MNWKKLFNFRYILISLYVLITALLLYCGSRAIDHIPELWAAVTGFFRWFRVVLHPLITGFALCYLLTPVVNFFEQRLAGFRTLLPRARRHPAKQGKARSFRGLAVLLTFLLVLLALTLLLSLLISALSSSVQLANLSDLWRMTKELSLAISNFYQDVLNKLATLPVGGNDFTAYLQSAVSNLMSFAERFLGSMLSSVNNMGSFFSNLLFSLIFCVYFLLDGENILNYWKRVSKVLLGQRLNRALSVFFSDADRAFAGYIRGQVIDALIMTLLVSVSLSVLGVRYGLIIGILTGLGNLIPYVGPFVAYGSTALVCILYGDYARLISAFIALFVIQTLDGNVINPRLLSSSIDIHPLLVIASLLVGGAVGGILGMLLAVPVGTLVKIQFERLLALREARRAEQTREG